MNSPFIIIKNERYLSPVVLHTLKHEKNEKLVQFYIWKRLHQVQHRRIPYIKIIFNLVCIRCIENVHVMFEENILMQGNGVDFESKT